MSADLAALADLVIWSNLRAALLVGIVVAALALCKAGGGRERHALWLTVCLACLALPVLSVALPDLPVPLPRVWPASIEPAPAAAATAARADMPASASIDSGTAIVPSRDTALPAAAATHRPAWLALDWLAVLVALYVGGVAGRLGSCLFAARRIARLESSMRPARDADLVALKESLCRELGIRRRVALLECDGIASPLTWGCLRPRVALPVAAVGWSQGRLQSALLHELGHVRRCDWAVLWLLQLAAALYWFNPLVRTAVRQCVYEAERACDDLVLGAGGRSSDYAEQLVELMTASRAGTEAALALGGSHFARRVRAILRPPEENRTMSPTTTRAASGTVILAAIGLAACQVTGQPVTTADEAAEPSPPAMPVAPAAPQVPDAATPPQSAAQPARTVPLPARPVQPLEATPPPVVAREAARAAELGRQAAARGRQAAEQGRQAAAQGRQAAEQGRQAADQGRQAAEQSAREARRIEGVIPERQVTSLVELQAVIERQAVALREAEGRILSQRQAIAELEQSVNALREQIVSREIAEIAPARPEVTPATPTPTVPTPDR